MLMSTGEIPIIRLDATSERAAAHDGFDEFCRAEHTNIVRALTWALGDSELGRDAADEAFARAVERWDKVSGMSNPAGWVYRVGLNWGKRRMWRAKRGRELTELVPVETERVDQYADPDLARALAALPVSIRSVIVMRHLLGYSEAQTADALNVRPGTVKSRTNRGLARLRQELASPPEEATEETT